MIASGFELPLDVLRSRRNVKWAKYAPDVLPAWVAEMDFAVAHPIRRAIDRLVTDQEYGYAGRTGDAGVPEAFAARMQDRFDWTIDPSLVLPLSDLVQGTFAALTVFAEPGDGIILQLPAYPPFHAAITETGRRLIPFPLASDGSRFVMDLDAMKALIDDRTRVLLLCNPQNPTGRVWGVDELEAYGRIAIEHDLIIVSDEIHCDLLHGDVRHIPIASLSPEIAARTITLNSPTKSFNIPGLRCGVMHFGSQALKDRFDKRIPGHLMGSVSIFGLDATVAAWRHGQPWLDDVKTHLTAMRDRLDSRMAAELPGIRWHAPEATYLGWLDCSRLGLGTTAFNFFHDHAKVALSPGENFLNSAGDHVRINFATSARILDEIITRMAEAVRRNARE
jgi:cystathionine beta-lyase